MGWLATTGSLLDRAPLLAQVQPQPTSSATPAGVSSEFAWAAGLILLLAAVSLAVIGVTVTLLLLHSWKRSLQREQSLSASRRDRDDTPRDVWSTAASRVEWEPGDEPDDGDEGEGGAGGDDHGGGPDRGGGDDDDGERPRPTPRDSGGGEALQPATAADPDDNRSPH